MKILQNNFTTLEQSKRLLKLGVPADSADCYYYVHEVNGKNICNTPSVIPLGMGKYGLKYWWAGKYNDRYVPCWSVGRLIEILAICCKNPMFYIDRTLVIESGMVDYCMRTFANSVKLNIIDFSKLEIYGTRN